MRRLLIAVVLFAAGAARAQQAFEAVVSGIASDCVPVMPAPPSASIRWFAPDRSRFPGGPIAPLASGDHQRVFAVIQEPSPPFHGRVIRIEPDGTQTTFYDSFTGVSGFAITVAANGRVFVVYEGENLAVISAAGTLEGLYVLPAPVPRPFIAIGPDSCTLYYEKDATGGAIARFDVCNGTPLPDFTTGVFLDIDPLPDGQVLLSSGDQIFLYSAAGTLVREVAELSDHGFPGNTVASQIALNPAGTVLYATATEPCLGLNRLVTIDYVNGELTSVRPLVAVAVPNSLVIGPLQVLANVPAAGTLTLLALAMTIALAAVWLLRR
jgi:hypothetical protein